MKPLTRADINHICRYDAIRAAKEWRETRNALEKLRFSYSDLLDKSKAQQGLIDWFHHYISDKQYEKIPPEKDFELRDALKKCIKKP